MMTFRMLRGFWLVSAGLLLTACDDGLEVRFAQPFPAHEADMTAFPARHRAVYTAADSSRSLCVGRTAVWEQELRQIRFSRRQVDSVLHHHLQTDNTYQEDGRWHYLHLLGRDSVRDSWLRTDTVFTLTGSAPGVLRRFQGRYYLNTPDDDGDKWRVQRLEIEGPNLHWQTFSTDTLRLLALDPATVRYHREHGRLTSFQLTPATNQQTRRVGRYAGLWDTKDAYQRRH